MTRDELDNIEAYGSGAEVGALVAFARECDERFAALSPNGDLLDALLSVLDSPGNGAAVALLAMIAARGSGRELHELETLLAARFAGGA